MHIIYAVCVLKDFINSMRIVEAVKSFSKVQSKHNFATQITKYY